MPHPSDRNNNKAYLTRERTEVSPKDKHCQFYSYEDFRGIKFTETESRMAAVRRWEEGEIGNCLISVWSFSLQGEKFLEMGYTAMQICLTLLNCVLRNGEDGKLYVLWFYTI